MTTIYVDPHLHILRSVARLVTDARARGELEQARTALYLADCVDGGGRLPLP